MTPRVQRIPKTGKIAPMNLEVRTERSTNPKRCRTLVRIMVGAQTTMAEPVLSQITPFNQHRFDAVIRYLSARHGRTLTQNDIVKIHVMTDVYHVIDYGMPVMGGQLEPWKHGAVVQRAYNRIA